MPLHCLSLPFSLISPPTGTPLPHLLSVCFVSIDLKYGWYTGALEGTVNHFWTYPYPTGWKSFPVCHTVLYVLSTVWRISAFTNGTTFRLRCQLYSTHLQLSLLVKMLPFHSLLYTADRQITVKGVSWPHANIQKWRTVRRISSSSNVTHGSEFADWAEHVIKNYNSEQLRMGCGWLR